MKKATFIVLSMIISVVLSVLISGCEKKGETTKLSGSVKIAGSSTVFPISAAVAVAAAGEKPRAHRGPLSFRLHIQPSPCTGNLGRAAQRRESKGFWTSSCP